MHETAVRALGQQEAALDGLRTRVGTLLTASALVASFLGGQAIERNGLTVWTYMALLCFVGVVVAGVYVLLPRPELVFALDIAAIERWLSSGRRDEQSMAGQFAFWLQRFRARNKPVIARLERVSRYVGGGLVAEIILLGLALL
jgi:hypothetical protein